MPLLAVIADDLTGANDTGVQFAKYGLRTHVVIAANGNGLPQADVVVVNTDSRGLSPQAAYKRVAETAESIKQSGVFILYKKVDSTLRGNLGSEIDAVLDVFGFECAVVVPAFPRNGRITVGGYHLLNQVPLQLTEIAKDPKSPVTDSRIVCILAAQTRYPVGHIHLADVLAGPPAIEHALLTGLRRGEKLVAADATDEQQLASIAQAVRNSGRNVLWVGSAGMAEFLPALYGLPAKPVLKPPKSGGLPVLVVAGSMSSVTGAQISAFLSRPDTALVTVNGARIIAQAADEINRSVNEARSHLELRRHVAVVSECGRQAVEAAYAAGKKLGLDAAAVSDLIAASLGEIARILVSDAIEGIFLTGGDTAVRVCTALEANSMEVCSEVAPGIPFGRLSSGPHAGLKVVTKAGAFGDEQAINKAVTVIQNN